jgi:hypothetical protein
MSETAVFSPESLQRANGCLSAPSRALFLLAITTPLAYIIFVFTFIESSVFEKIRPAYLDEEEYAELQQFMMQNPEAGEIVPGSGGVRKLRWRRAGMGKRGGIRVIHFLRYEPSEFWMLTLYAKAKQDNIPAKTLRQLLEVFRNA